MISWSQNVVKMQSSSWLILYSGTPTSEFLPGSVHHLAVFFPRPSKIHNERNWDETDVADNTFLFPSFRSLTFPRDGPAQITKRKQNQLP